MVRTETVFTKEELFDEPERSADNYDHIKRALARIDEFSRIENITDISFTKHTITDRKIRDIINDHAYHAALEINESIDEADIFPEVKEYIIAPTDSGKGPSEKEKEFFKKLDKIMYDMTQLESVFEDAMIRATIPLLQEIADFNKEFR